MLMLMLMLMQKMLASREADKQSHSSPLECVCVCVFSLNSCARLAQAVRWKECAKLVKAARGALLVDCEESGSLEI